MRAWPNCAFTTDGTLVATPIMYGTARISDVATGTSCTSSAVSRPGLGVTFRPDGTLVATASYDGTARIWDVATEDVLHVLRGHAGPVLASPSAPTARSP